MEKHPFQIFENKAEDFGKLFLEFSSVDLIAKEFVIESAFFDEKYKKAADVRDGVPFKHIFESLQQYHDLPCVYQFDIADSSTINAQEIKDKILQLEKHTPRILKSATFNERKTLYVGKTNGCMWGRLIEHLGYHKRAESHGLQLHDWAKNTNLIFKLYVYFFPIKYKEVMPFFEKALADEMHPLIGTHYI